VHRVFNDNNRTDRQYKDGMTRKRRKYDKQIRSPRQRKKRKRITRTLGSKRQFSKCCKTKKKNRENLFESSWVSLWKKKKNQRR